MKENNSMIWVVRVDAKLHGEEIGHKYGEHGVLLCATEERAEREFYALSRALGARFECISTSADSDKDSVFVYDYNDRNETYYRITKCSRFVHPDKEEIMNVYNGHDRELVDAINYAWNVIDKRRWFGIILFALAKRDAEEISEKFEGLEIVDEVQAMDEAHTILEHICDDEDLRAILKFMRIDY